MKNILLCLLLLVPALGISQTNENQEIIKLIDRYAQNREVKDSLGLSAILTKDIDQLVSSGVWRKGYEEAINGMLRSSTNNPGSRKLEVENVRFLAENIALVDARYTIENLDGAVRKMWSTFLVSRENIAWKIAGIRNMLPAN